MTAIHIDHHSDGSVTCHIPKDMWVKFPASAVPDILVNNDQFEFDEDEARNAAKLAAFDEMVEVLKIERDRMFGVPRRVPEIRRVKKALAAANAASRKEQEEL